MLLSKNRFSLFIFVVPLVFMVICLPSVATDSYSFCALHMFTRIGMEDNLHEFAKEITSKIILL